MREWNYVATAHQPTNVTHSCVCNFTSSTDTNLILAKCTHIEIHRFDGKDLQTILVDVPIYGRIATLEPFGLPHSRTLDRLFVATEERHYFVLQWDPVNSKLVTREMGLVTEPILGRPTDAQIGIIDPKSGLVILHLYQGLFKVIHFDDSDRPIKTFDARLWVYKVLDIKFLIDCSEPTIAVLYQDINGLHHLKTYKVSLKDKGFVDGPFSKTNLQYGVHLLISVPAPLGGLLIIGDENIAYCNDANVFKSISIEPLPCRLSITKAYGRVDPDGSSHSRYLLGDHTGSLRLLLLTHGQEKGVVLKIEHLGETSVASTISYLKNEIVYIGSSYGDSQLIKLNLQHVEHRDNVKVLRSFGNLGPIQDFCMVDLERQGLGGLVVTCSGAHKDGSLRIVYNALGTNEQVSVELRGIKGIWSLKSSTDDRFDKFLVVTFVNATRFLAMNDADVLEETAIEGFCSEEVSLYCHDAIHNQLTQITSSSVRLVSSSTKEFLCDWSAPSECGVATANATQILLATKSKELVYLEIGDRVLSEINKVELKYRISCLDIHSIDNPNRSLRAAVGLWDHSVEIYSLPDLDQMTKVHFDLAPEGIPRSVLLCAFEGIPYLLCGMGSGDLLYFLFNTGTGQLTDKKVVSPGAAPITALRTSSSNVLAVSSDWSVQISSSGKELVFSNINLRELTDMCPFNTPAFPERYAMVRKDDLSIGTIDDRRKLHIRRSIPLGEHARCICHQQKSKTYAICTVKSKLCAEELQSHLEDSESGYVRCLDDENLEFRASFPLHTGEHGRSIISCSFSNVKKEYYCVGTAYVFGHENESYKGRILIFSVEDDKFKLVAQTETAGAVYCLNGFQGKLLAAIGRSIQLYKWVSKEDGTYELEMECARRCNILALSVQTREEFIVVGDLKSILLLLYKGAKGGAAGAILRKTRESSFWMSAFEMFTDHVNLGATRDFNLITAKCNYTPDPEEDYSIDIVGQYHLGEFINRFQRGSIVQTEADMIPSLTFGTDSGMIGVIASLSEEEELFLMKIEWLLRDMIGKGVGGLSHAQWRRFSLKQVSEGFVDGDLIELFLGLERSEMEKISNIVNVSVEELCHKVEKLRSLH